jgi:hypothetical protein
MDDLPNSMTLAQEIVVSSIFSVTKILVIEDYKLNNTFLHVAFRSQSRLKPTSDQTGSDTNLRTEEDDQRGVNGSQSKIPQVILAYILKLIWRTSLLTRSRSHSYRRDIGLRNQVREMETQWKHNKMQVKPRAKPTTTKIDPMGFSLPHPHFIEHLADMTKKPTQEHN